MLQEMKEEEDGRAKRPKMESFEDMQLQEDAEKNYEEVTASQYFSMLILLIIIGIAFLPWSKIYLINESYRCILKFE